MRSIWLGTAFSLGLLAACSDGADSEFDPGDPSAEAGAGGSSGAGIGVGPTDGGKTDPGIRDGGEIDCDADPAACLPPGVCGDSLAGLGESCDDGNVAAGDGCSPTCQVEASYWACAFGVACVDVRDCAALIAAGLATPDGGCAEPEKVPVCGDGVLDDGELCDDHNILGGDGCAFDCQAVEADWLCSTPGQPCVSTVECGDGRITGSETCDDRNVEDGDGCTSTCQLVVGWSCALPGTACSAAACGDGIVAGAEQCDDGGSAAIGCDANCRLETITTSVAPTSTTSGSTTVDHYACAYPDPNPTNLPQVCAKTVCGNGGAPEGSEQCDDGNRRPYDGCSPNCEVEADCRAGECLSKCGDGRLFDFDTPADADALPDEQCDDGNTVSGDGCSATCTIESGFTCAVQTSTAPEFIDVPTVFRDFNYYNEGNAAYPQHPDFQRYACGLVTAGIVANRLDASGIPVYADGDREGDTTGTCTNTQVTSATSFSDWYHDVAVGGVQRNKRVDGISLRLTRQANGSYAFSSNTDAPYTSRGGFYPIENLGWHAPPAGKPAGVTKNGAITTELRYAFTFDAAVAASATPPKLDFSGDDDVWVFVNGRLALDIGGLHGELPGSFTLNTAKANELQLVDRHVYEIALFHAERMDSASNFKLTIRGFDKRISTCTSVCGDGIQTRDEQCDLGDEVTGPPGANSPGAAPYGGCSSTCKLGAYCGDATQTPPETCDDGVNLTSWTPTSSSTACGPSCTKPAYCGDQQIQGAFGERCDNGAANTNDPNAYGSCTLACKPGPRCGDKTVQAAAGEQCDNGFNVSSYVLHPTADDCAPQCKTPKSCGDGTVDYPFEQCDNGAANSNAGAYGSCTVECKLGPRCGDGVLQAAGGEGCDDGNRVNGDGCSAACVKEANGPH